MKTCVIIPAYNESRGIGRVVKELRDQGLEVTVIDDGSQDNTSELAQASGATVIRNATNQGKGASLRRGFQYALDSACDAVITMDGDGQHNPQDVSRFLTFSQTNPAEMLIGNRMQELKNMPLVRVLTNRFMSWLISKISRQNIPDTQCGFRFMKRIVLENMDLKTSKFEIESEMLIEAARKGFKIESVPIATVYAEEISQINPFVDTLRFIRFIVKRLWTLKS